MCSRPQFTDLTYMGGTGPCGPMTIIFGSVIKSQHTSLNVYFSANRTFDVRRTPVYRIDLNGKHRTLWTYNDILYTDIAFFQYQPACWQQKLMCKFSSLQLFAFGRNRVYHRRTDGRTDGRTDSNILEFCADQMSLRNIGSQIIISMCYKRIDKTNIPSMTRDKNEFCFAVNIDTPMRNQYRHRTQLYVFIY